MEYFNNQDAMRNAMEQTVRTLYVHPNSDTIVLEHSTIRIDPLVIDSRPILDSPTAFRGTLLC